MTKKVLTKAQKDALGVIGAASTMAELTAAVADLKPAERDDKRVGFLVYQATERIVAKSVPLP